MTIFAELVAMLQQEAGCTQTLLGALQTERKCLESRDLAGMQSLLANKSEALNQLEGLRQTRSQWLRNQGLKEAHAELAQQLETMDDTHARLASELLISNREIIDKCNYINNLNGILISNSRKRNSRQLDLMRGLSREQKLYTASGNTESRTSQNITGQA